MRSIVLTLALMSSLAFSTDGNASDSLGEALGNADQLANDFASCEGFFTFMADFSRQQGQDANSEYIKTFANGSHTAGLWLLSAKYQVDNPNTPARRLGDFEPLIEGPAEIERLRFAALAEAGNMQPIEMQSQLCRDMLKAFDPILQQLRQQMLGPKPTPP